jgi:hypothetical protein
MRPMEATRSIRAFGILLAVVSFSPWVASCNWTTNEKQQITGGWGNVAWGATEEEVARAYQASGITRVDPPVEREADYIAFELPNFELDKFKTKVRFFFSTAAKQLVSVLVVFPAEVSSEETFKQFEDLLTQKYGKPTRKDATTYARDMGSFKLVWHRPDSIVELQAFGTGIPGLRHVSIAYRKPDIEALKRL